MTAVATTADETPVWVPVGDDHVLAVHTRPTVAANGTAVVVCSSGHWVTTIGTNRIYVRMARSLAARGYHVVRYDYLGIGESTGETEEYRLEAPHTRDTVAVLDWLRGQGVSRFVLLGNCYGSRVAMATVEEVPTGDIAGVALYPPAVRDFGHGERAASLPLRELVRRSLRRRGVRGILRKLANPGDRRRYRKALAKKRRAVLERRRNGGGAAGANGAAANGAGQNGAGADGAGAAAARAGGAGGIQWVSPKFVRPLERLTAAGVPVLCVFGHDEDFYLDFQRGRDGHLGRVLDRAGDLVTVTLIDGNAHGLATVAVQDQVVAAIDAWLPVTSAPAR